MLNYFFKFKSFLHLLNAIEINWKPPKQSDVLIYDATSQECLMEYLSPWRPEVLHVRREQVNILVLISSIFRRGRMNIVYVDCYIKKVRPRLIITFIDNNKSFYKISRRHPEIKTLFVQNGFRSYYHDVFELLDKSTLNERNQLHVDYMMTLGSGFSKEYSRYISGSEVQMGSLKSNSLKKTKSKKIGIISFVSQWYEGGLYIDDVFYSHTDYSQQVDQLVISCLAKYAKSNNKRLLIIPRKSKSENLRTREELYFQGLLEDEVEYLEPSGNLTSYQATDISEVVVTIDSTLGYESLARGNKTAFFSIRSNILDIPGFSYGWPKKFPDEGLFWTNISNNNSFFRILDYLFSVNDTQWREDIFESGFSSVMTCDPGNVIFKSIIEKELGLPPISA